MKEISDEEYEKYKEFLLDKEMNEMNLLQLNEKIRNLLQIEKEGKDELYFALYSQVRKKDIFLLMKAIERRLSK